MKSAHRKLIVLAIIGAAAASLPLLLDRKDDRQATGATPSRDAGTATALRRPPKTAPPMLPTDIELPPGLDYLAQPGVPDRQLAGVVLADQTLQPIAGAHVCAYPEFLSHTHAAVRCTTTEAAGAFDLGILPPVRHMLMAEHDAGVSRTLLELANPRLPIDDLTILLSCSVRLTGRVVTDAAEPLPDATVTLAESGSFAVATAIAHTDADGRYEICADDEGGIIEAQSPGFGAAQHRGSRESSNVPDIVLRPATAVRGRVIDGRNAPVPEVLVVALVAGATRAAFTDAAGRFQVTGLPPGQFRFFATGARGRSHEWSDAEVGPEGRDDIVIPIPATSSIFGRLVADDGSAAGIPIYARTAGGSSRRAVSQADGSFELTGVPLGEIRLVLEGAEPTMTSLTIGREPIRDYLLSIQRSQRIRGRVIAAGQPQRARVCLDPEIKTESKWNTWGSRSRCVTSTGDGQFEIPAASDGTYHLSAAAHELTGTVMVTVAGSSVEVDISLAP